MAKPRPSGSLPDHCHAFRLDPGLAGQGLCFWVWDLVETWSLVRDGAVEADTAEKWDYIYNNIDSGKMVVSNCITSQLRYRLRECLFRNEDFCSRSRQVNKITAGI